MASLTKSSLLRVWYSSKARSVADPPGHGASGLKTRLYKCKIPALQKGRSNAAPLHKPKVPGCRVKSPLREPAESFGNARGTRVWPLARHRCGVAQVSAGSGGTASSGRIGQKE